jgi:hypothetical protein
MMRSHLVLMIVFAFFVSLVFALLGKEGFREQFRFGAILFAGFVITAVVLGWLMYPFPI